MQLLTELIGKKVTVFSEQGDAERQDVVTLESTDGTWIKARKSETELMYFNFHKVRMIKPFDAH